MITLEVFFGSVLIKPQINLDYKRFYIILTHSNLRSTLLKNCGATNTIVSFLIKRFDFKSWTKSAFTKNSLQRESKLIILYIGYQISYQIEKQKKIISRNMKITLN